MSCIGNSMSGPLTLSIGACDDILIFSDIPLAYF